MYIRFDKMTEGQHNINDRVYQRIVPDQPSLPQFGKMTEGQNDINDHMFERNVPDQPLLPKFDIRSKSTRYVSSFPFGDIYHSSKVSIKKPSVENDDFYRNSHVDVESDLRNQQYVLQHDTPQGVFIPSSQSELYKTTMPSTYSRPHSSSSNKHSLLFQQPTFHTKIHPFIEEQQMNKQVFNNSTKLR